jgi:hypothetical protein
VIYRIRKLCFLLCGLTSQLAAQAAPQNAPVATAFRNMTQNMERKLLLAAEAMPADKYSYRASPGVRSFGETVWWLSEYTPYLCAKIADVQSPQELPLTADSPKDSLLASLRTSNQFCDQALKSLDDSRLAEPLVVDLRPDVVGPAPPMTRAAAMTAITTFWSDVYVRLTEYDRSNGIVPENPCTPEPNDPHCGSGRTLCYDTHNPIGGPGFVATLSDLPGGVSSDGRGPYVWHQSNVLVVAASRAVVLGLSPNVRDTVPRRALIVDLRHPVPNGGGVSLGVITDSATNGPIEVAAQWYAESDRGRQRAHATVDIPIGTRVYAAQTDVSFYIDSVLYVLQMGPQPFNHCFADPPTINGRGTSRGTILRADSMKWIVDVPPGSVARLFDVSHGTSHAVDKGLYDVSMHFVIEKKSGALTARNRFPPPHLQPNGSCCRRALDSRWV